jgi:molybdopterin molybdotransferase
MFKVNRLPLPLNEAQLQIWDSVETTKVVAVNLWEADGYVLAEDVVADADVPHFEKSMLDGFAVRAADVAKASHEHPIHLQVIETVPAGYVPMKTVIPGSAIRIMTGAMMPEGADAVCRFEITRDAGDRSQVEVLKSVPVGEAISCVGEDVRKGLVVMDKGIRIGAAEIGMLATFGYAQVKVYSKPIVGILSSGTELIEVGEALVPGKVRNSNSYMVSSLVHRAGGIAKQFRPVSDDIDSIVKTINEALNEVDILVTTGGVSVGDYDLMHEAFEHVGAQKVFWKVMIRPGSPVLFARKGVIPLIGMSGNPAAAFVNAELFLLPTIRKMAGEVAFERRYFDAKIGSGSIKKSIKPVRLLRAYAFMKGTELLVDVSGSQSAGVLSSFLGTNCLVYIESGQSPEIGETVRIQLYGELGTGIPANGRE